MNNSKFTNLFLVFISCTLSLLLLEGGARMFLSSVSKRNEHSIRFEVSTQKALSVSKSIHDCYQKNQYPMFEPNCNTSKYKINNLGFHGDDIDLSEIKNKKRIIILGESVAFGWGASSTDHVFSSLLSKKLENSYVVTNAGVPSMNIKRSINYYNQYAKKFDPDTIIIFCAWNDILSSYRFTKFSQIIETSLSYSVLLKKLYKEIIFKYFIFSQDTPILEQYSDTYYKNLKRFIQKRTKENKKVILMTVPTYLNSSISYDDFLIETTGILGFYAGLPTIVAQHQKFNNILRKLTRETKAQLVDLATEFNKIPLQKRKALFFNEVAHLNDQGNQKITDLILHKNLF